GLAVSIGLWWIGVLPVSFPEGEPMQDVEFTPPPGKLVDYQGPVPKPTRRELNRELRKEMLFLLPPMLLAAVWWFLPTRVSGLHDWWFAMVANHWVGVL